AEVATGHGRLFPKAFIDKLDSLAIRHTKSPMCPTWRFPGTCSCRRHWQQFPLSCRRDSGSYNLSRSFQRYLRRQACRLQILSCCGRRGRLCRRSRATGARINRFLIFIVRGERSFRHILVRAFARINKAAGPQFLPALQIARTPLALNIRDERSTDVRTFTPVESEPAQI